MIHELRGLGLNVAVEQVVPINYKDLHLEGSYRVI